MTEKTLDSPERGLPPTCRDVLHLLGRGATAAQIADALHLPPQQVDDCILLLQARFGAADRRGLRVRVIVKDGRE